MKRSRVHVGEDGFRAHVADGFRRGKETVGRHDHLITRADARGLEGELQGRGPRAHRHRVFGAHEPSKLLLELLDPFSADEVAGFEDRVHGLVYLLLDRGVLGLEVEKRNSHLDKRSSHSSHSFIDPLKRHWVRRHKEPSLRA